MAKTHMSRRTAGRHILATGFAMATPWARAEDGVTGRQILIGQSITLQAGKNDYGVAVSEGIAACLGPVNLQGGVNGRQIILKTLDDDNSSTQAEANARALVEQHKAFVLFGSIEGGPSTAVMKAAVDLKVPFFGPMAGSPTLRRPHQPLVFRCALNTVKSSARCSNTPNRPAARVRRFCGPTPRWACSIWTT
jgi:ABC-type branched-subunit amino acid transport system substrate-binding protein